MRKTSKESQNPLKWNLLYNAECHGISQFNLICLMQHLLTWTLLFTNIFHLFTFLFFKKFNKNDTKTGTGNWPILVLTIAILIPWQHQLKDVFYNGSPEHLHLCVGVDSCQGERFAKLKSERVFALDLSDNTVVDGQPIHAGYKELTGQQTALINQHLIGVLRVTLISSCQSKEKQEFIL